jgi:hypothetical protein
MQRHLIGQILDKYCTQSPQGLFLLDELKELGSNPVNKNEFHKLIGKHLSKSGKAAKGKDPDKIRAYFS